jgi:hypothetical protein
MKLYRVVPLAVLLFVFTFTNVASAYSAPSWATLTTQLQELLLQLNALLGGGEGHELTAATTVTPVATPRTCQVNIYTRVNGIEKYATTTIAGSATTTFAIALSVGTDLKALPHTEIVQTQTWGNASTTGVAGYVRPVPYTNNKAALDTLAADPHYVVLGVPLKM